MKQIAKNNNIDICLTFLRDGLDRWPHVAVTDSLLSGVTDVYSGNFISFEDFVLKMMGITVVKPITIQLNSTYKAFVTKDSVTVGCQEFSKEKIEELYNALKSFE